MMRLLQRCIVLGVLCCAITNSGFAATLYLDPATPTLNLGDTATMAVRLNIDDSVDECVNAVDGVLQYAEELEVVDISLGQSIFSMWIEKPTINKDSHTVTFAGGIPNGYCGRVDGDPRLTNVIAEIVVRAPSSPTLARGESQEAQIGFTSQTIAYLNDGFGTAVTPQTYGSSITLTNRAGSEIIDPWKERIEEDNTPPAPFPILFEKNSNGDYYVIVNTTDKQSGIDQYQIMEQPPEDFGSFSWGRADAPWITMKTPQHHVLKDQSLNSIIFVKALDKAGNEYVATYIPDESLQTLSQSQKLTISLSIGTVLFFGLIFFIIYIFVLKPRRQKSVHKDTPTYDNE